MFVVAKKLLTAGQFVYKRISFGVTAATKADIECERKSALLKTNFATNASSYAFDASQGGAGLTPHTTFSSRIVLTNLPPNVRKDFIKLFMENKRRSGGGDVTSFELDEDGRTAVVAFKDPTGEDSR